MVDVSFEQLCKRFVEQADVGIGWTDINGNVKYLNPKLTEMLALDNPEEFYDKPVFQFYEPEKIAELEDQILLDVMHKGSWKGKIPLKSQKGEVYITMNYLFALKDDIGKVFSFANIVYPVK